MKNVFLRGVGLISAALAFASAFPSDRAQAGWPPGPNDDLTNTANQPNDPDYQGRWNYWSYLPKQDTGTGPYLSADVAMGASGMSVDKAWSLTTGKDEVHIAILDSGYEWDNPDTANKVLLNMGELTGTQKPQNAQGQACTALNGYDCNGDGIFTVADYKDDPRFAPIVTGRQMLSGHGPDEAVDDRSPARRPQSQLHPRRRRSHPHVLGRQG